MERDYAADVQIRKHALEDEWLRQPHLCLMYQQDLARASARVERAKEELEFVEAECMSDARDSLHDGKKPTESAVREAAILDNRYRTAKRDLRKAQRDHGVLAAAARAIDHKKSALENLVRLHGQGYFSTPRTEKGAVHNSADMRTTAKRSRAADVVRKRRTEDEDITTGPAFPSEANGMDDIPF